MTNVFIDTNILLNFFSYSNDHLNKLEEFVELIKQKKIRLFITQQVIDEFNRNRDVKLKEVLTNLNRFSTDLKSPVVCHDLEEMKELQDALAKVSDLRQKLIDTITLQIKSKSLKADKFINEIFLISKPIDIAEIIFTKAKRRFDIGNPPGKNNSYGDAINWEILLETVPESENLYFIARDKDYISTIDSNDFSSFLKDEWKTKKKGEIFYYDLLSKFLKDNFVETKITDEEIKEERTVAELEPSGSIDMAYNALRFTPEFNVNFEKLNNRMAELYSNPLFVKSIKEIQRRAEQYSAPQFLKSMEDYQKKAEKIFNDPAVIKELREFEKKLPDHLKQIEDLNKKTIKRNF